MDDYQKQAKEILYNYLDKCAKKEEKEMQLLASGWGTVRDNLKNLIEKLAEEEILSEERLFKLRMYEDFLIESNKQVTIYSNFASGLIEDNQKYFAKAGLAATQDSISLLGVKFNKINLDAVRNFIGVSQDGTPLNELLKKSYPETVSKITDTLLNSVALGRNPLETARLMEADMDGNLMRAMRIARTEQMNILRQTSILQMKESGVCKGWQRIEQPDACTGCAEVNGKKYSFDETWELDFNHPNCRGGTIPIVG